MLYDKDIREPLFDFLEENYGRVRIFEEKNMGNSRADIVMVGTDYVMGIEIKSDADSYTRLATQIKDYDRFFDKNLVVVGSTHAKSAGEHVPEYWGILSVELIDERVDIYCIREPKENPASVIGEKIKLLWRPELAHIQELCGLYKYSDKSKDYVRQYIVDSVDSDKLNILISEELFERDYSRIADDIKAYRQARKPKRIVRKRTKKYRRKKKNT